MPSGVSAFVEASRTPGGQPTITFGVTYRRPDGAQDIRKFRAGVKATDEDVDHARKTALAFRAAFLAAAWQGQPFDPSPWRAWRIRRLY